MSNTMALTEAAFAEWQDTISPKTISITSLSLLLRGLMVCCNAKSFAGYRWKVFGLIFCKRKKRIVFWFPWHFYLRLWLGSRGVMREADRPFRPRTQPNHASETDWDIDPRKVVTSISLILLAKGAKNMFTQASNHTGILIAGLAESNVIWQGD